jgi:hypothetical protein
MHALLLHMQYHPFLLARQCLASLCRKFVAMCICAGKQTWRGAIKVVIFQEGVARVIIFILHLKE